MKYVTVEFKLNIDLSQMIHEMETDGEEEFSNDLITSIALECIQEDLLDVVRKVDDINFHTTINIWKE